MLPTENEIRAMGGSTRSLANGELGTLRRRSSQTSSFDSISLERLSKSHSHAYVGSESASQLDNAGPTLLFAAAALLIHSHISNCMLA